VSDVSGATSVRKFLNDKDGTDHQTKFNSYEFWLSMLYETLPPVVVTPLIALLMEGSFERAYNLVNHRLFLPVDTNFQRQNPKILVRYWLWDISLQIMVHFVWLACLGYWTKLEGRVCPWEVFMAFLGFLCRNAILSIKYAYYNKDELAALRRPAPRWTDSHQERKKIGQGWRYPMEHQNLVEDELAQAQALGDVCLQAASFKVDKNVAKILRKFDCHEEYRADNGFNEPDEVAAGFVVHQFIRAAFGDDIKPRTVWFVRIAPLVCGVLPNVIRLSKGQYPFGNSSLSSVIHLVLFVMRYVFFSELFLFGYIASHDFTRGRRAMKLIGRMTQFPWIRLGEFCNKRGFKGEKKEKELKQKKEKQEKKLWSELGNSSPKVYSGNGEGEDDTVDLNGEEEKEEEIDLEGGGGMITEMKRKASDLSLFVDLRDGGNAFAWVLARRTTKMFGVGYFLRVQAYVGVLFTWAFSSRGRSVRWSSSTPFSGPRWSTTSARRGTSWSTLA